MFSSKSPIVKFAGYFLIGIFLLVIIISFGMPDVCGSFDMSPTAIAVVNGKNIDRIDFARLRDNIRENPEWKWVPDSMILDRLIVNELLWQYTQKLGFDASDERIVRILRTVNQDVLRNDMRRYNISFQKLENLERRNTAMNDLDFTIMLGMTVSQSDAREEYIAKNSKIQIRYAFLSKQDLMKRHARRISVTDEEISAEMKNNPGELKDPATDKDRIKEKLTERKISLIEDELIDRINAIAVAGGSFANAAAVLQGSGGISDIFTPGDSLKEQDGRGGNLAPIENSRSFRETCMSLPLLTTSEPIRTSGGIYIFTPIMRQISRHTPPEADLKKLANEMQTDRSNSVMNNLLMQFSEKSKVTKNFKPD